MGWETHKALLGPAEIDSAAGRALVEERYAALRKQVPVIYLLAAVNILALQITTSGALKLGFNLPTLFLAFGIVRSLQWLVARGEITHELMLRRLRQTWILAVILCGAICLWCLHLLETAKPNTHMAVLLFGCVTATGVAYGLSALPRAALAPLVVLALPLASVAFLSPNPQFVGAALSLMALTVLISRLLLVHNAHFTDLIQSRTTIARERRQVEHARQEAILAATTDVLTGLPNRRAFVAALDAAVEQHGGETPFTAAVLDLNHFKTINDTFGHGFGDEVLRIVASRLLAAVGSRGYVARLGGDEFGLLFPAVATSGEAEEVGERIIAEVNRPALIEGTNIQIQASCGLGLSRQGVERSPSRALADADIALYDAKAHPTRPFAVFELRMEAPRRRRTQIEHALQAPNVQDELAIAFQPIVDLETGRVVAQEALARWRHHELGEVQPSEFIPIAEQLHLISGLSDHLLKEALNALVRWPAGLRLSFNLSAVQLCTEGLAESILGTLQEAGVAPDRLQVEVTETALLVNFARARTNLAQLREAGVLVVLDDFGAGYASIGYLREIHFDQVKLDGAMVIAAAHSADGERLLRAVIDLCRALDLDPVAEHVENGDQRSLLLRLGCKLGQGFWIAPPMSAEDTLADCLTCNTEAMMKLSRSKRAA